MIVATPGGRTEDRAPVAFGSIPTVKRNEELLGGEGGGDWGGWVDGGGGGGWLSPAVEIATELTSRF